MNAFGINESNEFFSARFFNSSSDAKLVWFPHRENLLNEPPVAPHSISDNRANSCPSATALIGDTPLDVFNTTVREKISVKFGSALSRAAIEALFRVSRLDQLLSDNRIPAQHIDIIERKWSRTLDEDQGRTGRPNNRLLMEKFAAGATIRLCNIQWYDPSLSAFCAEAQRLFLARAQINAYFTPPQADGLLPHFDPHDVFIVQCEGRKQWRIYEDYSNRLELPLGNAQFNSSYRPLEKFQDLSLSQGDTLYIPRGVMHEASCQSRESLHLTVSLTPLTAADVLLQALIRQAQSDVALRRGLGFGDGMVDEHHFVLERNVRAHLQEIVGQLNIRNVIDHYFDEIFAQPNELAPSEFVSLTRKQRD